MTNSKLVALAVSFLLASPGVGFAASGGSAGGVGYAGTGAAAPDTIGASVVGIPDMAIGGPPALDVRKDLPSTAPGNSATKDAAYDAAECATAINLFAPPKVFAFLCCG
jgi:hypothetical protein